MAFRFLSQAIPEVQLIEHDQFGDERGFFTEVYRASVFDEHGLPTFVQDNHSRSAKGVLRGLHFQDHPRAAGKLVHCVRGRVFDVAVDIRTASPTYCQWVGVELSEEHASMLYVPVGFAHGFCVLSDVADVIYKQSDYYSPEHDRAVRWDDPAIGVTWPVNEPLVSTKDAAAPLLGEVQSSL